MQRPYPSHLRVGIEHFNKETNIPFMDLLIVRLHPLKTSVYFKPTHTCSYIPWNSNTPRHVKVGWITAECIRFLRLCSHEEYFWMCWRRLKSALVRFRYPHHVYAKPPRMWADRDHYLKPKARTTEVVHVVRVPFHASMPIPWTALFTPIRSKFKKAIPDLQVRVTLKPSPNLRLLFHSRRMHALRRED